MDSQTMSTMARNVQDCARRLEQLQNDITLHLDGVAPPQDVMDFHWKRLSEATFAYKSASDELSSWLQLQLADKESFRNMVREDLDKRLETRLDF